MVSLCARKATLDLKSEVLEHPGCLFGERSMLNIFTAAADDFYEVFCAQAALKPLQEGSINKAASALVTTTHSGFLENCGIHSCDPVGDPKS